MCTNCYKKKKKKKKKSQKYQCVLGVKDSSSQVDVSHLALQVHLCPSGEEQLYNISLTFVTGQHEGSYTILRNTMRQNSTITVMNMEKTIERCTLAVRY